MEAPGRTLFSQNVDVSYARPVYMAPSNLELDQTDARRPFLYIYATFMNVPECPHSNTRAQTLAPTLILLGDALSPPCAPSPRLAQHRVVHL